MDSGNKDGTYLVVNNGATLRKFKDYPLLKVDVFNPQSQPVTARPRGRRHEP